MIKCRKRIGEKDYVRHGRNSKMKDSYMCNKEEWKQRSWEINQRENVLASGWRMGEKRNKKRKWRIELGSDLVTVSLKTTVRSHWMEICSFYVWIIFFRWILWIFHDSPKTCWCSCSCPRTADVKTDRKKQREMTLKGWRGSRQHYESRVGENSPWLGPWASKKEIWWSGAM